MPSFVFFLTLMSVLRATLIGVGRAGRYHRQSASFPIPTSQGRV
ncbi:hypothetical protein AWT69_003127 [Pseudomonas putida]|nr:hypothetical protein AWT69_003127 [Pseudomonas putida]